MNRGTSLILSNAARFSASATPSSVPPSMYSKIPSGNRLLAAVRRSAML
jgi:hypothetical protein